MDKNRNKLYKEYELLVIQKQYWIDLVQGISWDRSTEMPELIN